MIWRESDKRTKVNHFANLLRGGRSKNFNIFSGKVIVLDTFFSTYKTILFKGKIALHSIKR